MRGLRGERSEVEMGRRWAELVGGVEEFTTYYMILRDIVRSKSIYAVTV